MSYRTLEKVATYLAGAALLGALGGTVMWLFVDVIVFGVPKP